MATLLIHDCALQELNLFGNPLGNDGARVLLNSIRHNRCLRALSLAKCGLDDAWWARGGTDGDIGAKTDLCTRTQSGGCRTCRAPLRSDRGGAACAPSAREGGSQCAQGAGTHGVMLMAQRAA